jgi:hypothetical protein
LLICSKETKHVDQLQNNSNLDTPVWGAKAIGKAIDRGPRQVFHLLDCGLLDATKVGKTYVSTRRRLLKSLGVEVPPPCMS